MDSIHGFQWVTILELFSKSLLSRAPVSKITRNNLAFFQYSIIWNTGINIEIDFVYFLYIHWLFSLYICTCQWKQISFHNTCTCYSSFLCTHMHLTRLTLQEHEAHLLILNYEIPHFIPNNTGILWCGRFCLTICDLFRARHT